MLSALRCRRDFFRNIKDEIILEVSKAIICRHMKKKSKTVCSTKENILQSAKCLPGYLFVKRVMVKASIPPSISEETVRRVL